MQIEKILSKIKSARKNGREIPTELTDELVKNIKDETEFFVLMNAIATTPLVIGGRAYIFTSKTLAEQAGREFKKAGVNVSIVSSKELFDTLFQFFVRYGIETVSINKGKNGVIFGLSTFINPELDIRKDIYNCIKPAIPFNVAINNMIRAFNDDVHDEDKRNALQFRYESEFTRAMSESKFFFASEGDLPEKSMVQAEDGTTSVVYFVFSDITELFTVFPLTSYKNIKSVSPAALFEELTNLESCAIVLNAGTSNITIGFDNIRECMEYQSLFDKVYLEAKQIYLDKELRRKMVHQIMKYRDIYCEFLNGVQEFSGFEYPENSDAVNVEEYTANSIQRMIAKNPIDAYAMLSAIRDNPEKIDAILRSEEYISNVQ